MLLGGIQNFGPVKYLVLFLISQMIIVRSRTMRGGIWPKNIARYRFKVEHNGVDSGTRWSHRQTLQHSSQCWSE